MKSVIVFSIEAAAVLFLVLYPYAVSPYTLQSAVISGAVAATALVFLAAHLHRMGKAAVEGIAAAATTAKEAQEGDNGSRAPTLLPAEKAVKAPLSPPRDNARNVFVPISTALKEKTRIIPVLLKQLSAIIEYTDEAANGLSTSFMQINAQAKHQVGMAEEIFGSFSGTQGESETENVLLHVKNRLDELMASFTRVVEINQKNLNALGRVAEHTRSMRQIVYTTESIADQSKVLSINATIEAARAGERGHGFSVVAREFKQLAQDSEQASQKIHAVIDSVETEIEELYDTARTGVSACKKNAAETEQHIKETLERIDDTIAESKSRLAELSTDAEELAKAVSTIVVSIQFQDITRQRIEHVIGPLRGFAEELGALQQELESSGTLSEFTQKDHKQWLEDHYTMEEEKVILRQTIEGGRANEYDNSYR